MGMANSSDEPARAGETRYERSIKLVGLGSAVFLGGATLLVAILLTSGTREKTVEAAKNGSPTPVAERGEVTATRETPLRRRSPYASKNWGFLEHGAPAQRPKEPGVRDLSSPDWDDHQNYKDLHAMAVFETQEAASGSGPIGDRLQFERAGRSVGKSTEETSPAQTPRGGKS